MKIKPPSTPTKSPKGAAKRRTPHARTSSPAQSSPLGVDVRSPRAGVLKTGTAEKTKPWRSARMSELMKSGASDALRSLSLGDALSPPEAFGPALNSPSTAAGVALPDNLAQDKPLAKRLLKLRERGTLGQMRLPTTPSGAKFMDESNLDEQTYTLPTDYTLKCVAMHDVKGMDRQKALVPDRLRRILTAVEADKALPPIRVTRNLTIDNGFHRYFVSAFVGYSHIDVMMPK